MNEVRPEVVSQYCHSRGIASSLFSFANSLDTGLLRAAIRQLLSLERGQGLTNLVSFLAAVTMALSVAMSVVCGRRWRKEYGGSASH